MPNPQFTPSEQERIEALRSFSILDSGPEEAFDDLARLAAQTSQAAAAFICFIDSDRIWPKAQHGCHLRAMPRHTAVCNLLLHTQEPVVIEDLSQHPKFKSHPLAAPPADGTSPIPFAARLYAAVPLITAQGHTLGAISILDPVPRSLPSETLEALKILARQVITQLELRQALSDKRNALRDSEALYVSLVENLPQNIFRKDLTGRFTFANRRFCQSLNKSLQDILGKTDFDFFPAELAEKYQQDDHQVLATLQPRDFVEAHRTPDGRNSYVQVVKTPVSDSAGTVIGIQGIFWDVTQRKRVEEDLAHERDLLRALLEHIPDSIYFKDQLSRFLTISKALAARLGLHHPDEAAGRTDFDFFAEPHALAAFQDEQLILRTGQPVIAKTEKEIWRDGRERWVLTSKMPLRNHEGAIIGTFGISKDITELKQAEADIALARDAALESARLKSEFLANMSHEIRTPMNAILGMTGLLMDTSLDSEQRDFANTIHAAAEALLNIINDILDFSKIEAGKLDMEVIDFDLGDLVEGTVELLAEQAQAKGLELVYWVRPDVSTSVRGDPGRLRQVLTNLLSNAVKFTETGEVVLEVLSQSDSPGQTTLRFAVRDTGIGILPEAQSRLFQAFTQADGSLTRRYGGTGLGLAISKQLIDLMNGQIGCESIQGQGSTFWFSVTLEKQPRPSQLSFDSDKHGLEGVHVLVVDDNATNRLIVHHQVVSWKMRNGSAASGAEALAILKNKAAQNDPYEIVLLDMQMPEMDGLEVARRIAEDPQLQSARVIVLTSLGHHISQTDLKAARIAAYLIKPVKPSRLYDCLVNVLNTREGLNSASSASTHDASLAPAPAALRVLVAEDNSVNQKVALRQLAKLGYHADAVGNGKEVLLALHAVPYPVVLLDCHMPEMDGYEAARQIRARESSQRALPDFQPVYIIAMTANALAGDREECLAAGMNDYVAKPVRLDDLKKALHRALHYREGVQAASLEIPPPTLDLAVLDGLRELGGPDEPDPVRELTELFLSDTPLRINAIQKAISSADPKQLESAAHCLKGSSSNLGARQLASLCSDLIILARQRRLTRAPAVFNRILSEFQNLQRLLGTARK